MEDDEVSLAEASPDEASMALIAHGLLNSVSVVSATATLLRMSGSKMEDIRRDELLGGMVGQANLMAGVLKDLVHGLPIEALDVLQRLGA